MLITYRIVYEYVLIIQEKKSTGGFVRLFLLLTILISNVYSEQQLVTMEKPLLIKKIQIPILQKGDSKGFVMFDLVVKLLPNQSTRPYLQYLTVFRDTIIRDLTQALSVNWIDGNRITKESLEKRLKKVMVQEFDYIQNVEISSYIFSHRSVFEVEAEAEAKKSESMAGEISAKK